MEVTTDPVYAIISVELTSPYVEPSHANDKSSEMDFRILTDKGE